MCLLPSGKSNARGRKANNQRFQQSRRVGAPSAGSGTTKHRGELENLVVTMVTYVTIVTCVITVTCVTTETRRVGASSVGSGKTCVTMVKCVTMVTSVTMVTWEVGRLNFVVNREIVYHCLHYLVSEYSNKKHNNF